MATSTRALQTSFTVEVGDWIRTKVLLTSAAAKLAEKHNLTPTMVEEMGKYHAGYPIVDERVTKGLVKRGIMVNGDEDSPDYRGYEFTPLGEKLCSKMFALVNLSLRKY